MTALSPHHIDAVAVARRTGVRWRIFLLMLTLVSVNYIDRKSVV